MITFGTCSLCGGPVVSFDGGNKRKMRCDECQAIPLGKYGPVIEMAKVIIEVNGEKMDEKAARSILGDFFVDNAMANDVDSHRAIESSTIVNIGPLSKVVTSETVKD